MKIKTTILSFVLTTFLFCANNATAQKQSKQFSFGFGLEAGLVTGELNNTYKVAPGITLRASYKVGPGFATLTSGGLAYLPKNLEGQDLKAGLQIPVKAGYKYIFSGPFFVMGELGFSTFKYYYEGVNNNLESISQSGFTYAPTIGVQTGVMEIGLRYEATALKGGTLSAALLRVGFNF